MLVKEGAYPKIFKMTTSQFFRKETENPVVKWVRDSDTSQKENNPNSQQTPERC